MSAEQFAQVRAIDVSARPTEYTLANEMCLIGRDAACQIVVQRNVVSRLHAKIERNSLSYILYDAGSANGTYVNGRRIHEPHVLHHDDQIGLGATHGLLIFIDPNATVMPESHLRYDDRFLVFFFKHQALDLSPAQLRLLRHLYQHTGNLCTRESCAQAIWGRDYDPGLDSAALDQAVAILRSKFRQVDPTADLVKTRRGVGYVLTL